jgi:hypothetical protein
MDSSYVTGLIALKQGPINPAGLSRSLAAHTPGLSTRKSRKYLRSMRMGLAQKWAPEAKPVSCTAFHTAQDSSAATCPSCRVPILYVNYRAKRSGEIVKVPIISV